MNAPAAPLDAFNPGAPELEQLRPVLLDVAERVLTETQLHIFVLHCFAGQSQGEIARCLGVSRPAVTIALNGQRGVGGILKRIGEAVKDDKKFHETVAAIRKQDEAPKQSDIIGWFKGSRPDEFPALAFLFYLTAIVDAKGTVSFSTLYEHMPKLVVNQLVSYMRARGWILTDGITITVYKTPKTGAAAHG